MRGPLWETILAQVLAIANQHKQVCNPVARRKATTQEPSGSLNSARRQIFKSGSGARSRVRALFGCRNLTRVRLEKSWMPYVPKCRSLRTSSTC